MRTYTRVHVRAAPVNNIDIHTQAMHACLDYFHGDVMRRRLITTAINTCTWLIFNSRGEEEGGRGRKDRETKTFSCSQRVPCNARANAKRLGRRYFVADSAPPSLSSSSFTCALSGPSTGRSSLARGIN